MARYSKSTSKDVKRVMEKRKSGTLKSGPGGKGGTVTSRKQVPPRKTAKKKTAKKKIAKKKTAKKKAVGKKKL